MNSHVDEIQDFVKTNVQMTTDKKGKLVTFIDQLPLQATANSRNRGASSSQMTRRDREVVDFTRSRVKNISKLTNLMKMPRIEGYNDK